MIKQLLWIFPVIFGLSACEQSAPIPLPTSAATATSVAAPTCTVVFDMTSTAIYPVELLALPGNGVFYRGQVVETAVTGGFIKWSKLQICGDERTYLHDFKRTVHILIADQSMVEFVCGAETCPVTFTIPGEIPSGGTKLVVQIGHGTAEYDILIRSPETSSPGT